MEGDEGSVLADFFKVSDEVVLSETFRPESFLESGVRIEIRLPVRVGWFAAGGDVEADGVAVAGDGNGRFGLDEIGGEVIAELAHADFGGPWCVLLRTFVDERVPVGDFQGREVDLSA
jgi:hypothetical protein